MCCRNNYYQTPYSLIPQSYTCYPVMQNPYYMNNCNSGYGYGGGGTLPLIALMALLCRY